MVQLFTIVLTLLCPLCWSAWAQNTSASTAETLRRQINDSQGEVAAIGRREKSVLNAYNDAEFKLNQARLQVRAAKTALDEIQFKIDRVDRQHAEMELKRKANADYASQRLNALYKLNWSGRLHLLTGADSFFDFIVRKNALERVLAQDEQMFARLQADRFELENVRHTMNRAKAEKKALEEALNIQLSLLGGEQQQRAKLLQQIRTEKALKLASLKALRQAASELDAAISSFRQAPSASSRHPQSEPSSGVQPPVAAQKSFDAYKGLLSWPVKGKVISRFGAYRDKKYNVENFQSGIDIQAERGEPIRAVAGGSTIYSSWFKGFGNVLIIDHGDHYYTVYAHLEEMFKAKGDRVDPDEVVATVGDSGRLDGPVLHFEVRHHGKPADPLLWMKKG